MSLFFFNQSYSDFDVYREEVKAWDLEFFQLGQGSFHADALQFGDQDLMVGKVYYNKLLLQNGSAPQNGYTFAVHHQHSAPFLWRYLDFDFDSIIVFPENRELHGISQPGHHPLLVTISEKLMEETSHVLGLPEPGKYIEKGSVSQCDPVHMSRIRQYLYTLCTVVKESQGQLLQPLMEEPYKYHIARLLALGLADAKSVRPRKRGGERRRRVVERTIEYINSDLTVSRSIPELSRVANVDERTLRNMFYEHFSLSPQKFLKSYRLNKARSTLLKSNDPKTKVADIANQYGFWHMGQFAADYRMLFGELPSRTLANARAKRS
jgi:AraC family ethanolamine operon transcriptional activator